MLDAKKLAKRLLFRMGFGVEDIPEADQKRADLMVTEPGSSFLVEVKLKHDNEERFRRDAEAMAQGHIVEHIDPASHDNKLSGILRNGSNQLNNTPSSQDAFRLIWLQVGGVNHCLYRDQAFATFYGSVTLIPMEPGGPFVNCLYFDFSAAKSLPSVDAMILLDGDGLQLWLNEFSVRLDRFCKTALHARFARDAAIVDPRRLVADGSTIACRFEGSRKNANDVIKALQEQTGVRYQDVRPNQYSASVMVNHGGSQGRATPASRVVRETARCSDRSVQRGSENSQ